MTTTTKVGIVLAVIIFGGLVFDAYLYFTDPAQRMLSDDLEFQIGHCEGLSIAECHRQYEARR